jgi:hypothetical protein
VLHAALLNREASGCRRQQQSIATLNVDRSVTTSAANEREAKSSKNPSFDVWHDDLFFGGSDFLNSR